MTSQTPTISGKQAVLDAMPDHPAIQALLAWNPEAFIDAKFDFGELTLTVAPDGNPRRLLRRAGRWLQLL